MYKINLLPECILKSQLCAGKSEKTTNLIESYEYIYVAIWTILAAHS